MRFTYKIQKGENPADVAERYTGKRDLYIDLLPLNPHIEEVVGSMGCPNFSRSAWRDGMTVNIPGAWAARGPMYPVTKPNYAEAQVTNTSTLSGIEPTWDDSSTMYLGPGIVTNLDWWTKQISDNLGTGNTLAARKHISQLLRKWKNPGTFIFEMKQGIELGERTLSTEVIRMTAERAASLYKAGKLHPRFQTPSTPIVSHAKKLRGFSRSNVTGLGDPWEGFDPQGPSSGGPAVTDGPCNLILDYDVKPYEIIMREGQSPDAIAREWLGKLHTTGFTLYTTRALMRCNADRAFKSSDKLECTMKRGKPLRIPSKWPPVPNSLANQRHNEDGTQYVDPEPEAPPVIDDDKDRVPPGTPGGLDPVSHREGDTNTIWILLAVGAAVAGGIYMHSARDSKRK